MLTAKTSDRMLLVDKNRLNGYFYSSNQFGYTQSLKNKIYQHDNDSSDSLILMIANLSIDYDSMPSNLSSSSLFS